MMKKFLLILFSVIPIACLGQKQVRSAIREGNASFEKQAYLDSEICYRKALEYSPNDSIATFNLGNSLFRQQEQEKVKESLSHYMASAQKAQSSGNKQLAAKAYFNAGDVMMAAQQYDKAVQLFKQSLMNDPKDDEARYNLLLAQKLLQQNQNQDQQDQQNQDQQDQDQQQDQQNQDQQNQDQQNQNQQNQDQQQQQQQQQNQMSKEQAEAILNANNRDEKETQQKVQEKLNQQIKRKQTNRDW